MTPFSLRADQQTAYERDGFDYLVYVDPGAPPQLDTSTEAEFLEGFEQVLYWSAHLDPADQVMVDASPNEIGNATLPTDPADFAGFYDAMQGGDIGAGYATNPVTGEAYPTQMVPRGDYARACACHFSIR